MACTLQRLISNRFVWCCVAGVFLINIYIVISQLNRMHTILYEVMNRTDLSNRKMEMFLKRVAIGVNSENLAYLISNDTQAFECLDASRKIKISSVNDDYCDCPDGSDEPGTNACNNGRFYCSVERKLIPSFYVNDGLCDCCDGADEWLKHPPNGFILPLKYPTKMFTPCTNNCD